MRRLIDARDPDLSVRQQCELLGLNRSSWYYEPVPESADNLALMRLIDAKHLERPYLGSRRLQLWLEQQGYVVNRKRVQRLLRLMGLEVVYPKPRLSEPRAGHKIYPYLLRELTVTRPDQVWCSDITYLPLRTGFLYLTAIMDWYSRYVLTWRLSNSLDAHFCVEALDEALSHGRPEIFNTDQGCQFTGRDFTGRLEAAAVAISMDGRGRALDNVFVERLWRTVKYENVYLEDYQHGADCHAGLSKYFSYYCEERPHQGLNNRTPSDVYFARTARPSSSPSRSRRSETLVTVA